jgi:hypothetical protein
VGSWPPQILAGTKGNSCSESPKESGERSRLWCHDDIVHVLQENTVSKIYIYEQFFVFALTITFLFLDLYMTISYFFFSFP